MGNLDFGFFDFWNLIFQTSDLGPQTLYIRLEFELEFELIPFIPDSM